MTDVVTCLRLINVHFPQVTRAGHSYLNHLMDWLLLMAIIKRPLIIGGDFDYMNVMLG